MSDEGSELLPSSLMSRMIGAARLDERFYREISEDPSAILQAVVVVVLAAMATLAARSSFGGFGFGRILLAIPVLTAWWAILTLSVYVLAMTLFRSQSSSTSWIRLARPMGFAQSPLVLRGVLILPFIPEPVVILLFVATIIWQFAAITVVVRQTLKVESTVSAALMVGIALFPLAVIEPLIVG